MNKKNKVLSGIFIILNCIITYFIASNSWVNRMPSPNFDYSFIENLYDLFFGRGVPTALVTLITVIVLFAINKLIIKQEMKLRNYIFLFCIIFFINIIIYRIGIGIAV